MVLLKYIPDRSYLRPSSLCQHRHGPRVRCGDEQGNQLRRAFFRICKRLRVGFLHVEHNHGMHAQISASGTVKNEINKKSHCFPSCHNPAGTAVCRLQGELINVSRFQISHKKALSFLIILLVCAHLRKNHRGGCTARRLFLDLEKHLVSISVPTEHDKCVCHRKKTHR